MLPIVVLLTSAWSGQSHPPLLPDMRGWTRLAFRMRRQFGVRPRSMVRLGRTLRANFMEAEPEAMAALATAVQYRSGYVLPGAAATRGQGRHVGLLFFPGGLVHEAAYAPILRAVAEASGATVVCVRMPVRHPLAVQRFRLRKLRRRVEAASGIEAWVVGGHSLGAGALGAAGYAAMVAPSPPPCAPALRAALRAALRHGGGGARARVDGLVMWAGALTVPLDLRGAPLRCVAIFGSEDSICPPAGLSESGARVRGTRRKLPRGSEWVVIRGGNHAGFGHYGEQRFPFADGARRIPRARQQARAVSRTAALLRRVARDSPAP